MAAPIPSIVDLNNAPTTAASPKACPGSPTASRKRPLKAINTISLWPEDAFPADVEIQIFSTRYLMHSSVLILSSEFFKASLSGRWKAEDKCEETSDDGGSVKYSFHLRVDEEGMPYLAGGKKDALEMKRAFYTACLDVVKKKTFAGSELYFRQLQNTECNAHGYDEEKGTCVCLKAQKDELSRAFDIIFRIFHHRFNKNASDIKVGTIMMAAMLGDQLMALSTVAGALSGILLQIQKAENFLGAPLGAAFGIITAWKLRLKGIFHDAFVHLVGNYDNLKDIKALIPSEILALIEKERARLVKEQFDCTMLAMSHLHFQSSASTIGTFVIEEFQFPFKCGGGINFYTKLANLKIPVALKHRLLRLTTNRLFLQDQEMARPNYLLCAKLKDDEYPWDCSQERW